MPRPLLPALSLLLLPLLSPAQPAPAVSLSPASLVLLPGDTAVDVAVLVHRTTFLTHFLAIASRGNNQLYSYVQTRPQRFGRVDQQPTHAPPLSILGMNLYGNLPMRSGQDDLLLLTQNGLLTSFLFTGATNDSVSSVPLRQGLPCAPTDRLLKGDYLGLPAPLDVALWSNGPQPGISYAEGFSRGIFQARPRVPALPGDNARVMVTANLSGRASGYEDAIVGQATPAGGLTVWTNANTFFDPTWLPTATVRYASAAGPVVALAAADVNGDARPDVVAATASTLSLHLNSGTLLAPFTALPFPGPGTVRDIALADLNGDARPELLVLTSADILYVYQHAGPGAGASYASAPVGYFTGRDPARLRVDDADGDGDLDVLVPCRGDHTVSFFWNNRIPLSAAQPAAAAVALRTYPNPAQTTVQLRWDAATGGATATATLHDVAGRLVGQWPARASGTELPVAGLPRGLYLLRVAGERLALTQRLVLQ